MDSRLDNIFKTTFRHAEAPDTRMGIRREDAAGDQPRRHRQPDDSVSDAEGQDKATVSIAALRVFLAELIGHDALGNDASGAADTHVQKSGTPGSTAAKAAHAYQSTARTPPATAASAPVSPPLALSADDARTIRAIIALLQRLESLHVTELAIDNIEGGFLQSLHAAATKALSP